MPASAFVYDISAPPTLQQLVENGIRLWQEEAAIRSTPQSDIQQLWNEAEHIMSPERSAQLHEAMVCYFAQKKSLSHPFFETDISASDLKKWLLKRGPQPARAHQLMAGALAGMAPTSWRSRATYPHRDLYIAAFYLIESKQLLEQNEHSGLAASLTQAYYYLGMGSSSKTSRESASEAARTKGHAKSGELRRHIVQAARALPCDGSIKTISSAIDEVVTSFRRNEELRNVLVAFDKSTHKKAETPPGDAVDLALDRLLRNLKKWTAPKSPYPNVADAFARFKRGQVK
jgi:hypothetical protein